jgi:hypothetical protein
MDSTLTFDNEYIKVLKLFFYNAVTDLILVPNTSKICILIHTMFPLPADCTVLISFKVMLQCIVYVLDSVKVTTKCTKNLLLICLGPRIELWMNNFITPPYPSKINVVKNPSYLLSLMEEDPVGKNPLIIVKRHNMMVVF